MRASFLTSGIQILALTVPLALSAQDTQTSGAAKWQVTIAPRFGVFLPNRDMGGTEAEAAALTMTSSPTAGLDVELRTPVRWLSVRAIAETSVGSRLAERGAATTDHPGSCTADCDRNLITKVGESSVLTLVTDAVVRPGRGARRFQPMVFAGAGIKRYDLTLGNRYVAGGQESAFTFHFGGGLDIPVGPISLSFEAADYVSRLRSTIRPISTSVFVDEPQAARGGGTLKHDFFLTLGVRLFPR